ncbi:Protein CBG23374 [Caenorhabditis briggsae]|uniref:Glycosyltransferase family 92 protein n=1 Tax=Caenorhabditis briggsae TaxID=6238 RepID=A8Y426_CAEBR|nr:Protein CBG23374 [Caenorhabditis briggsae]CAP39646.2 Protein CBG23374 [Caenorhabditis briggsae]
MRFDHTHAYITSAYYYRNSKSLGENAVAMVVVMSQKTCKDLEKYEMTIVGTNEYNNSMTSKASLKIETAEEMSCEYVMVFVQAQTIMNPKRLEIESLGTRVQIPFREPRKWSHSPVIICIAPQFVAEKWQVFLMNIHVARRYGGHMHFYITSMVEELFNTLKIYESRGSLTLDYWVRMKFQETTSPYADPMRNVEWRNQAGAQTDCLLQYKVIAEFVAFFDIDDILIPRSSQNYHQEFSSHFNPDPSFHSIFYNKRDVEVQKVKNVKDFSFRQLFSTMKIRKEEGYGKSIVNPLKYNSTWIHHSFQLPRDKILKIFNTEIIHVKDILIVELDLNAPFKLPKVFGTESEPLIRETDLKSLDIDFQNLFEDTGYRETAVQMVDHDFYSPIVFKCYNESFYHPFFVEHKHFKDICPNADNCELPQREDIKCIHSDAEYISGPEMYPITFHYAIRPYWSKEIGCYQ